MRQNRLLAFSKDLKVTFHTIQEPTISNHEVRISRDKNAIYILQEIKVGQQQYSLFYDTGCCDMVSRYNSIKKNSGRAFQELPGLILIDGAGNADFKTTHGIYREKLSLSNGNDAVFSGVSLDQIRVQFPEYSLQGIDEKDVRNSCSQIGGYVKNLSRLSRHVGGNRDIDRHKISKPLSSKNIPITIRFIYLQIMV